MTVLVVGLGASGRAMAAALDRIGLQVRAVDQRDDLPTDGLPGDVVLGSMDPAVLRDVNLVVTSPGVAPSHPLLTAAASQGIQVWSEPELAWRLNRGRTRLVAVTGTNGKTTATQMIAACLDAPAAGNIGPPLVTALTVDPPPLLVAELSSFQLHFCTTFRPDVAVLLNVAGDHLDWHGGLAAYTADKARLWQAQHPKDTTVVWAEDAGAAQAVGRFPPPGRVVAARTDPDIIDPAALAAPGPHNVANATASAHAALASGGDPDRIKDTLSRFRTGAHRLELVATVDGVHYVNDSKATNPHAALAALQSYDDVVWIAGGLNKGLSFDSLIPVLQRRVRQVLTIGACGPEVAHTARQAGVQVEESGTVQAAVERAHAVSKPGMTVLLAPAAASMDQFADYADRGDAFRTAVQALRTKERA